MSSRELTSLYARNFIFGVEDSLVSTVGLLSGVAIAAVPRETIILTGVVLIFVEAFSMAVGSFLSEHSAEEYAARTEVSPRYALIGATVMFFAYFIFGFIPLAPYFFTATATALWLSILLSLAALFLLGAVGAKVFKMRVFRHGTTMMVIGGVAIAVGVVIGRLVG